MEVKWIKLAADVFENRKIRMLETMENGDAVVVIWFKLLCLAGQINDGGNVYFTSGIPYTAEMLASLFGKPLPVISAALDTFERFEMIERDGNVIHVTNWERYQNVDGMERIREQGRRRAAAYRERKRTENMEDEKALRDGNVTRNGEITQRNGTDIERDIEREEEREKDIESVPAREEKPKPIKHKYGEYKNVLLTDEELEKLKAEFPLDWEARIENLSNGIASKGYKYKSHYATIRVWARKDAERRGTPAAGNGGKQSAGEKLDGFYDMMADWAGGGK